jgi:LPS export ABC transporter permease LptF/LPS export ABC transporter permease LptG
MSLPRLRRQPLLRFRPSILFCYALKEVLPFILLAFLVLTTLIFAQQVGRQGEIIFNSATSFLLSLRIMLCLLPGIVVITLPFALLIGTLMALNRLSSDSELVAAQACGLSLLRLTSPLLLCGLIGTAISAWLTLGVLPRAFGLGKELSAQVVLQALASPLKPQTFDSHFPNTLVYVRDVEKATGDWVGVFLIRKLSDQESLVLTARRGKLRLSRTNPVTLEAQLTDGLALQLLNAQPQRQSVARFERQDIRLSEDSSTLLSQAADRAKPVQEMTLAQLARRGRQAPTPVERRQAAVERQKRFALPLACLFLSLMAIPVGARSARHSGRAMAFALGFALAVAYYIVLLAGQGLALSGILTAWLGAWLPNLVSAACGLLLTSAKPLIGQKSIGAKPSRWRWSAFIKESALSLDLSARVPRVGSLIGYLLLSEALKYFSLAFSVLLLTSLIFTLFDILPSLLRSGLGLRYGATYLLYLAPQIAYFLAPFAVLLSLLTAYGVLARSNQITALLASGQSRLKLSLPLAALAIAVTLTLFWVGDALLPATNRRQDEMYHRIKGRRVEQAAIFAGQKWVVGSDYRIYGYQHLAPNNKLLNAAVYRFDEGSLLLREMIYAREAVPETQNFWRVKEGWRYDLANQSEPGYQTLSREPHQAGWIEVSDGLQLFTRTVNEATKMSFAELRAYLLQLSRIGAPTVALRIDLEKKKAFPISCLTLIVMALPLLPIQTRRSNLAGLGISILIGFAFWIASSVFEAAGKQSLLPVWLAAWGGQALFLLLAVYLILRRRTRR